MTTALTPWQRQRLAAGMADLLRLRAADPTTPPAPRTPHPSSTEQDVAQRTEEVLAEAHHQMELHRSPDWHDEHLIHGPDRHDLLAWLVALHHNRHGGAAQRRATDDLTHDDTPARILRVLREEGFAEAARVPDYLGRDLRLLTHRDGWLAQVAITARPAAHHARLWISVNARAVDHELALAGPAWHYARDTQDRLTPLISGTTLISGTGLRVLCALLRASTLPVTPWQTPALGPWLAGEPPALTDDPDNTITTGLATAETILVLHTLPPAVRALINPDLLSPN